MNYLIFDIGIIKFCSVLRGLCVYRGARDTVPGRQYWILYSRVEYTTGTGTGTGPGTSTGTGTGTSTSTGTGTGTVQYSIV